METAKNISLFEISHHSKTMYSTVKALNLDQLPDTIKIIGKESIVEFRLYFTDKRGGGRYRSNHSDYSLEILGEKNIVKES